jgi:hypothetical protein
VFNCPHPMVCGFSGGTLKRRGGDGTATWQPGADPQRTRTQQICWERTKQATPLVLLTLVRPVVEQTATMHRPSRTYVSSVTQTDATRCSLLAGMCARAGHVRKGWIAAPYAGLAPRPSGFTTSEGRTCLYFFRHLQAVWPLLRVHYLLNVEGRVLEREG